MSHVRTQESIYRAEYVTLKRKGLLYKNLNDIINE